MLDRAAKRELLKLGESCKGSCLGALACDQATQRCVLPASTSCWSLGS